MQRGHVPARADTGSRPVNAGSCKLEPVYFDFNEYVLTTEATERHRQATPSASRRPTARPCTLTGRTDPRGTEEYNLALSDKRAQRSRIA